VPFFLKGMNILQLLFILYTYVYCVPISHVNIHIVNNEVRRVECHKTETDRGNYQCIFTGSNLRGTFLLLLLHNSLIFGSE
jgi:hypothetical protein